MVHKMVIAISNLSPPESLDLGEVVRHMLDGAASAGAVCERYILTGGAGPEAHADGPAVSVSSRKEIRQLVTRAAEADQLILALTGDCEGGKSAFSRFADACYEAVTWSSLADIADPVDAPFAGRSEIAAAVRFAVPWRSITTEHRGVVIVHPTGPVGDHDDPFCENRFFVLEELLRVLGFMPSGRILSTGLFFPPIEENPILSQQAFQLGRGLAASHISTPAAT